MGLVGALFFITFFWLLIGFLIIEIWEDVFDDISNRYFRVGARFAMLALWPAWLAFWAVCVVIAILFLAVVEICK